MVEKYCYNDFVMIFLGGREMKAREDKRMVKFEFFSKLPFLDIC